ncbi:D-alanyl-D-alanine carboxypeptidase [Streptomyces sp. NPDC007991]|uniref:D-alanyl-D-alanine carboxypeptidase n=1 Tax=Streptomyces sp. NPDC007991 TaxID=3364803 RepID=UPI0036E0F269
MAGESPDRSKQRESSAEPTSGSASPVPEARNEAPPRRDPRLAVARDTERSTKHGGADTATRVLSTRTAERAADAERDESDAGVEEAAADAERDAGGASTAGTADAERDDTATDTEQGVSGGGAERDADQADSAADAEQDDDAAERDESGAGAGQDDGAAERDESDASVEGTAADAERGADETDTAADAEQDADETDTAADAEQDADDSDAAGTADAEQDADEAGTAADPEQGAGAERDESGAGVKEAAADASQETVTGSAERGDDAGAGDGRLRDAVAAWVASADQEDEEPAAAKDADKGSEDGQEAAGRAEEPAESDTDAQEPEKPAEADVDARDDREADGADDAAEAAIGVQDKPKADGAGDRAGGRDGREEADEPEADRSATGGAGDSGAAPADSTPADDTDDAPKSETAKADSAEPDTDDAPKPETAKADSPGPETDGADESPESDGKGDAAPPVDQPTAVFKAVRPPVDQPTTMLKLGGAAKDAKDAPEKDAERTSKFVALKPLDEPSTRKPAAGAPAGQAAAAAPAPADATAPVPTVGPERTTQQPLPPRPPLDLLAELTNTPPPPDTPLRTAVRRVKIWTPLVLLLVVLLGVAQSVRPLPAPTLDLTAEDSYTFEGGKVDIPWPAKGQAALDVQGIGSFGSSGEQKAVPIASVAKVMTAYVILRDHPLKSGADGPKIEIDQAAEDQSDAGQESTVDVTKGDKISQREALESILIASANNVARLLARWDAGSEQAFVRKMNDAAKDLGMKNTTYTDPSGLNNTTVSTAVDQVKLGKAAMEEPAFREVAAMMSYVDYKGTKHDNWNRLVGYNDVTGIKTGTTTSALGNLVFSARKEVGGETRRIVGAVVRQPAGGPDNTILGAALFEGDKLIKAAQGALESATILKKGDVVGYADDGLGGRTPVVATQDVKAVGWAGLSVKLTFAADELPHTAKAGTKVGTLTVGDGSTNAVKVPVTLQKDLVEPGFADKLTRLG